MRLTMVVVRITRLGSKRFGFRPYSYVDDHVESRVIITTIKYAGS